MKSINKHTLVNSSLDVYHESGDKLEKKNRAETIMNKR